jgi:ribose/xylose/arabinose/galactoside ABC-type transport system permease subunit
MSSSGTNPNVPVASPSEPGDPDGRGRGNLRHRAVQFIEVLARVAALAAVWLAFRGIVGPAFFSAGNVENILRQSAVYAMAGLGMTMVIITGGIDLAAGSTIALSMVVTALTLSADGGETLKASPTLWPVVAILAGTAAGATVGLVQGALITGLRLVPFIVTLGGLQAIRGLAKGVAGNQEISGDRDYGNWLYRELMFPVQGRTFSWQLVPLGVWLTLICAILAALLLRYTKLGRRIYAVGSNEATARLCGVPVAATKVWVYTLAGVFAGLAGVLEFSKLNLGQPTGAVAYELYVIAACVIGGTSLSGGVGTIWGTVIGALIIGTLNAGAQQAGWQKWVQEITIGVIIVAAVALDRLRLRRAA